MEHLLVEEVGEDNIANNDEDFVTLQSASGTGSYTVVEILWWTSTLGSS